MEKSAIEEASLRKSA